VSLKPLGILKITVRKLPTVMGHTEKIRRALDENWDKRSVQSGLSSSEGLINALAIQQSGGDAILMVTEEEFASVLRTMTRHGKRRRQHSIVAGLPIPFAFREKQFLTAESQSKRDC